MSTLVEVTLATGVAKPKLTSSDALAILAGQVSTDDPRLAQHPELAQALAYANAVLQGQWSAYFKTPTPAPSRQAYFAALTDKDAVKLVQGDGKWVITCVAQHDNVAETASYEEHPTQDTEAGFRLRGNPTDLVSGRDGDAFAGASKASFNLGDNRVTKTDAGQIVGALGYYQPLNTANTFGFMPYVAGNYSVTRTGAAATKYASDTIDGGIYFSGIVHAGHNSTVTLALAPDYLHNFADGSSIVSLSPILTPEKIGVLNNGKHVVFLDWLPAAVFGPSSPGTYLTLFGDLRGDFGHYVDRGVGPDVLTNIDFAQVGSRFGIDIAKLKWYDLNIADLQEYGFAGARRHIYDFESSFTYYGGAQSVLGLTAAYKSGFIERSLQKEQAWTVGLTAKY
jgi:hypothetical protein